MKDSLHNIPAEDRQALTARLLGCGSGANFWQGIVDDLPKEIAAGFQQGATEQEQVYNLVARSLAFRDGIETLLSRVRFRTGRTDHWLELARFAFRLLCRFPSDQRESGDRLIDLVEEIAPEKAGVESICEELSVRPPRRPRFTNAYDVILILFQNEDRSPALGFLKRLAEHSADLAAWIEAFEGGSATAESKASTPRRLDLAGFGKELQRKATEETRFSQPYLLGDTFVGREKEMDDLTAWLASDKASMLCITNLGGTGKSALVWHWLHHERTRALLNEQGFKSYWCSFYARNFDSLQFLEDLSRELGGVTIVEPNPFLAQEKLLRAVLDRLRRERWLLVLDGLEREMGAFIGRENLQMDSEEQDRRNEKDDIPTLDRYIRSPIFADFLRSLVGTGTRVLMTSRIFPENLRIEGPAAPAARDYPFLPMSDEDAVRVWNLSGDPDDSPLQRQFFDRIERHPQVISVVAATVRRQDLSFTNWFNDAEEAKRRACLDEPSLTGRRHRWLELALRDLILHRREAWFTICHIVRRSEACSLRALLDSLVDRDGADSLPTGRFRSEGRLIEILNDLVKWRLIGVDHVRGLVDVHPVIRGQVWQHINRELMAGDQADMEFVRHMQSGDGSGDLLARFLHQSNLEEKFRLLSNVLKEYASHPDEQKTLLDTLARFYPQSTSGQPWMHSLPALRLRKDQALVLHQTAEALMHRGRWDESTIALRRAEMAYRLCGDLWSVEYCRQSHDWQSLYAGSLFQAERRQLEILERDERGGEESSAYWLALLLAIRQSEHAAALLQDLEKKHGKDRWRLQTAAEAWFYLEQDEIAVALARRAWDRRDTSALPGPQELWESVTIGLACLRLNDLAQARSHLNFAKSNGTSSSYNLVPMFALAGWIELYLREARATARMGDKRVLLANADVVYKQYCKSDEHNQFQIPAAEAHLAMAMVELERGNRDEAHALAHRALQVALGETPPFHYGSVVRRAGAFLREAFGEMPPAPRQPGMETVKHERRLRAWMQRRGGAR